MSSSLHASDERFRRLHRQQYGFAAHIRDPATHPRPSDVDDRRMAVYRDLFYNNIASTLASNFPVIRQLLSDEHWHRLVRAFFAHHRCQTPLFPELPREFLRYLQDERIADADDPPFLLELAHYEWIELALWLEPTEIDDTPAKPEGDLLEGRPVLSPLAWPLGYRFPVHRIRPDYRPESAPARPTYLVVYRDRHDDIQFSELNPVSAKLLNALQADDSRTGLELLHAIAEELQHPDPSVVVRGGRELLERLRSKDVILGTEP